MKIIKIVATTSLLLFVLTSCASPLKVSVSRKFTISRNTPITVSVENGMFRYKRIIGDRLRAKHRSSQKIEALIAVDVINRMTALGMPESEKIVA